MPDASPGKWHRAHTTWFFEQFVLLPHLRDYPPSDADYTYLFNSYYETVRARHPRPARGLTTRPGAAEITGYRVHVDRAMQALLEDPALAAAIRAGRSAMPRSGFRISAALVQGGQQGGTCRHLHHASRDAN